MNAFTHQTLVHVSAELIGGQSLAQSLLQDMGRIGKIIALSSVYKRSAGRMRSDLQASMETVLNYHTDCAVDELLWHFRQYTKDKKVRLTLLSYDDLVVLSPQLTLPHPNLHTDHLIVRCASEALPTYEHPIIQKTLIEMNGQTQTTIDAEFFLQGKSLVDFHEEES